MRILLTGASGWLGKAAADHLRQSGMDVVGVDRIASDSIVAVDLSQTDNPFGIGGKFDAIVHFAAAANVNKIFGDPLSAIRDNVVATANMLQYARMNGCQKFVYISSGWCAQWPSNAHVYTATKKAGEMMCHSWRSVYGLPSCTVRLGTLYGPGARGGTAIANFVAKALSGEPITIHGSGIAARRYLYIDDMSAAIERCIVAPVNGLMLDVCGEKEYSVNDVAEAVRRVVRDVPMRNSEARPGDLESEIALAYEFTCDRLEWRPKIALDEGIFKYSEWMRANQ